MAALFHKGARPKALLLPVLLVGFGQACSQDKDNICKCVLGGSVAGHVFRDSHKCVDGQITQTSVKGSVTDGATKATVACDSWKLTMYCTNQADCLTDMAKEKCEDAKKKIEGCDVDCSGAPALAQQWWRVTLSSITLYAVTLLTWLE
eukprot:TRINITY_DN41888_c0_g1_i1.p1 TRINITY_DN41888_c0_g1~~TRINITY_DN41888_c0_g1_i1.p1  ORF type:complete len:148 (-),score=24.50 TRINITY_DN41888_c0_g1_i1:134-577(-)